MKHFYHQGNSFCKLFTLEGRNNSLCIQQDQALSQTTLKMKVAGNSHRGLMVCKFVRAKLLKWLKFPIFFTWLTLETMNLDDYHANSQNFHEFAKLIFFCGISFNAIFITLVFRVVCFKEQLCVSLMMHNFKIGGI